MSGYSLSGLFRRYLKHRGYEVQRAPGQDALAAFFAQLTVSKGSIPLRRFGPDEDGGYLMPDDLTGIVASISPGVSTECRFDFELAERGIRVVMADASVNGPPMTHPLFEFHKRFIDTFSSEETVRLDDLCGAAASEGDLLLQMDIEGAEYRVINTISDDLMERFRIMIIEFHGLGAVFQSFGLKSIDAVMQKILRTHKIVHIHPNNCCGTATARGFIVPNVMEVTFHRRGRDQEVGIVTEFPHALDHKCVQAKPELVLTPSWRTP